MTPTEQLLRQMVSNNLATKEEVDVLLAELDRLREQESVLLREIERLQGLI